MKKKKYRVDGLNLVPYRYPTSSCATKTLDLVVRFRRSKKYTYCCVPDGDATALHISSEFIIVFKIQGGTRVP
jgi:hypothetical protein